MISRSLIFLFYLLAACAGQAGVVEFEVTTAPFDISKKYKSMEGPMVVVPLTVAGLAAEGNAMDLPVAATGERPLVWIRGRAEEPCESERELWWFLGAKIEALEPRSDAAVSQEFICHLNIDIDRDKRAELFPESPGGSTRLLTLTGGATDFQLPDGFGVPVASDEPLTVYFQALNHNRAGPHQFRHRLTLRFIRDDDLTGPIAPLDFHWPSIAVPVPEADLEASVPMPGCSCCAPVAAAANAPANSENGVFAGPGDRVFTGHWLVPPGRAEWNFPVRFYSPDFAAYETAIHAMIPHVHPYAQWIDLLVHRAECGTTETVRRLAVRNRNGETGLDEIELVASPEGISILPGDDYELRVVYENVSGEVQDSMATLGIFTADHRWKRPVWADAVVGGEMPTCGIPPPPGAR